MDEGNEAPRLGPESYRRLLERLEGWFAEGRRRHGDAIKCRAGCSACCYGPFDISVADVELLVAAVRRLPAEELADVRARATVLLAQMRALAPDWEPPYAIDSIGEDRFDRICDALSAEPCPLLDDAGRCRIYADRPLVCRLLGLGMTTPAGRLIENACPIQERFPDYAALPPVPFDLEGLEAGELECLQGAARRLLGSAEAHGFETTIAAALVLMGAEPAPGAVGS